MAKLVLLNKPFNVLCQFTDEQQRDTLANYIPSDRYPHFYAAGRLDRDSEGLLILTDNGALQHYIAHPKNKLAKTYWVQVEGDITPTAMQQLNRGVALKDGKTQPAKANKIAEPTIWARTPPIRERKAIPTSWISLTIKEGKNRQVRRMTAAVGFPTLRLIRAQIGPWALDSIESGSFKEVDVDLDALNIEPQAKKEAYKSRTGTTQQHAQFKQSRHRARNSCVNSHSNRRNAKRPS